MNPWKASGSPPLAFLCALALAVVFCVGCNSPENATAMSSPSSHFRHWYIRATAMNCCNCNQTSFPI